MPDYVKNNIFSFIVLILLLSLIYLQWVNKQQKQAKEPLQIVKRDTVYMDIRNYTNIVPKLVERIPYLITESETRYFPDTNYAKLVQQYHNLVEELLAKHIYIDTLRIDSIGYVQVNDTISNNRVLGRSYLSNLSYPIITNTVYQPEAKKAMLYWGVGMQMNNIFNVNSLSTGGIYKFKNNFMLGVA
jgi:hypothetical protein